MISKNIILWVLILSWCCLLFQCNPVKHSPDHDMKIHAFRLAPGQDLKKEIENLVVTEKIEAGWIMTCVGSLTQSHLRYANQPEGVKANGYFEIVSLVGTVSIHGSHLHLSVSDSAGYTVGGHLLPENIIYTTAEIVIGESESLQFTRERDGTTEWPELQVKKKR